MRLFGLWGVGGEVLGSFGLTLGSRGRLELG